MSECKQVSGTEKEMEGGKERGKMQGLREEEKKGNKKRRKTNENAWKGKDV